MKSNIIISIIWLVFTFIFVKLGLSHWEQSKQEIPKFKITKVLGGGTDIKKGGISIEKPFQDFANDFNSNYLEQQNKSNSKVNRNAALGYFVASLTSLFAVVLEWRQYIPMLLKKPCTNKK
jgi:hypothetical protein